MSKRATRSAASTSKSASLAASSSKQMPQAKKQKTVSQALADDPEPEESVEEKWNQETILMIHHTKKNRAKNQIPQALQLSL